MPTVQTDKRVAIVTGAARGIGKAVAERLLKDGLVVVVSDLEGSLGLLRSNFAKSENVVVKGCDVSNDESVRVLVEETVTQFGRLDVMVANAGIIRLESIESTTISQLKNIMDVNFQGVFSSFRYAAKAMKDGARGGRLIAATSLAGKQGAPFEVAYCSSKFAIRGLVQCAAIEYGPFGITVNAYAPGLIETDALDGMERAFTSMVPNDGGTLKEMVIKQTPLRRIGQPHEVAGLVSYLVSEEASFITGQAISIDGGLRFD